MLTKKDIKELHYICSIENLDSILKNGILSHKKALKLPHVDISKSGVQVRRAKVRVPRTGVKRGTLALHRHAILYLNANNAMMYVEREKHEDLCVLRIHREILDRGDAMLSSKNASAKGVRFFPAQQDGALYSPRSTKYLIDHFVFSGNKKNDNEHKQIQQAEALLPYEIRSDYIGGIFVSCARSKDKIEKVLHLNHRDSLQVTVLPSIFYQGSSGFEYRNSFNPLPLLHADIDSSLPEPDSSETESDSVFEISSKSESEAEPQITYLDIPEPEPKITYLEASPLLLPEPPRMTSLDVSHEETQKATYFLATCPRTVISIIQVGRLPDNFSQETGLMCFENIMDSMKALKTGKDQTFILELNIPAPLDSKLLTYVCAEEGRASSILTKQINSEWIQKIIVYSKKEQIFLSRLFNNECPKKIEINSEIYSTDIPTTSQVSLDEEMTRSPRPLVSLKQGDILGSRMQTVINTVNCVGVMGKGIALAFKQRYPSMAEDYEKRCQRREVKLGEPYLYKARSDRWIVNFPTKNNWREQSDIRQVENGLQFLANHVVEWGITSLAIPPLGCGNGGLNWSDVSPLIRKYLDPLGIAIEIYTPFSGTKAARQTTETVGIFVENSPKRRKTTSDVPGGEDQDLSFLLQPGDKK